MTEADYEGLVSALTDANVALTENGEFRSTYDILKDIADIWDELSSMDQAAIAESLSGTRQQAVFYSIIEQFQLASDSMDTMADSANTLSDSYDEYLDSTTAHINSFKAAFQELGNNLFQSDWISQVVDLGTTLLNIVDALLSPILAIIDALGGANTVLAIGVPLLINASGVLAKLGAAVAGVTFESMASSLGNLVNLIPTAISAITNLTTGTLSLTAALSALQVAIPIFGLVFAGISALDGLVTSYNQQLAEERQGTLDNASAAKEEADSITQLYSTYIAARDAYESNTGSKEDLESASLALLETLGYEEDQIQSLIDKYGDLDTAMAEIVGTATAENLSDLYYGIDAAKQEAVSAASDLKGIHGYSFNVANSGEGVKYYNILKDAGLLSSKELGNARFELDFSDYDSLVEGFEKLTEAKELLEAQIGESYTAEELYNSSVYQNITTNLTALQDYVSTVEETTDAFNEAVAREVYQDYIDDNGIPETMEEFAELRDYMLSENVTGTYFTGTAEEIQTAVDSVLSGVTELSDYVENYHEEIASLSDLEENLGVNLSDIVGEDSDFPDEVDEYIQKINEFQDALNSYNADPSAINEYVDAVERYNEVLQEAQSNSEYRTARSEYGNIDISDRDTIEWTTRNLNKYKEEIESWDMSLEDLAGTYSTVLGMSSQFEGYEGIEVAFSPILQTDEGAVLLSKDTVSKYITAIFDNAAAIGGDMSDVFALDADGLEIDGQQIQGLLADIGDSAYDTAEAMHYAGEQGALSDALRDVADAAEEAGVATDLIDDLQEIFPELEIDANNLGSALEAALGEMDADVAAAFAEQLDNVDSDEAVENLQAFLDKIAELTEVVGNTMFEIDMEAETDSFEALYDAINESTSATGLSADSITSLKARYEDLKGVDMEGLFELTANGIHLNTTKLRELESEYKNQTLEAANDTLEAMQAEYDILTMRIENCSDASQKAELYAERDDVKEAIEDYAILADQLEGLTSKYNAYEQAKDTTKERSMYQTIVEDYEDIQDTLQHGWVDDETRAYIDLLTYQDMSTASAQELCTAWENLNKTISGTSFSKTDLMQVDDDGNVTAAGLKNFYTAITQVQDAYDELWAWTDKDGTMNIDIPYEDAEKLAEALDLDVDTIQTFIRAMSEAGFDVVLDSAYSKFMNLADSAEECTDALNEALGTEYDFNVDTEDIGEVKDQVYDLIQLFDKEDFVVCGELDMDADGAEDAYELLVDLERQYLLLDGADVVMGIDTDELDGDAKEVAETLQGLLDTWATRQANIGVGLDTTQADLEYQEYCASLKEKLESLDPEVLADLNIDNDALYSAIDSITGADVNAGVELDSTAVATVKNEVAGLSDDQLVTLGITTEPTTEDVEGELTTIEEFKFTDKTFTVTATDNASSKIKEVQSLLKGLKDSTISLSATYTTHSNGTVNSSSGSSSGSSSSSSSSSTKTSNSAWHKYLADGTLHTYASGRDISIPNNQTAIVNELGNEGLIRNGVLTEIQGGMQKVRLKKGDIILNHKQMEELNKYGYVTSNGGRGELVGSYASGTMPAYNTTATGSFITVTGMVTSTSVSNSSSSKKSSSSSSSSSKSSSDDEDDSEIIDWIEIAIDRVERAIDNFQTIAESAYRTLADKLTATNNEITDVNYEIGLLQSAYTRYMQEANSVGLSSSLKTKVQNGTIDITEYDEDTASLIEEYQKWYEAALDTADKLLEMEEKLGDLYSQKFEDISDDYENQLSLIEHLTNTYNNAIDDMEERGYLVSTKYYEALIDAESENIDVLKAEFDDLVSALNEGMASGAIAEGSQEWYDQQVAINEVTEAIQEATTAIVEYQNEIRQLEWDQFDYLQDEISNITEEADFLIELMEDSDLFTDNGQLTDTGQATMGLHAQNYNVYMAQADKYAEEILALDKEIAEDPYNTDLLERRQELLEAQQDAILSANDEKMAIVDLVENGIELELDALQDLIDKYEDSLDSAKDLYDYNKKVKESTEEIASLQKQLSAYENDDSEETRATVQQLKVSLAEAQEDLEETQYEQYIEDSKKLLDDLYTQYETLLNQRLDDIDALITDMIAEVNAGASTIAETIASEAEKVGYTITENESAIWSSDGDALSVVTSYGESFLSQMTTVNDVISKIAIKTGAMTKASDATATSTVKSTSTTSSTNSSSSNSSSSSSSSSSKSSTTTVTDAIKKGVAAAIWVYGGTKSGWGNGTTRKKRLTEKFGSTGATTIQNYLNSHGSNGDLYKYWVNQGKGSLSKYYYSAYKQGGLADYTGFAWMDGTPSQPEMVLSAQDTANFIALKDAMEDIANGNSPLAALFGGSTSVLERLSEVSNPLTSGFNSGISIGDISYNVNIPIDHVEDYDDLVSKMRDDGQFEKMIQAMTVDQIVGGSKIAKSKYKW